MLQVGQIDYDDMGVTKDSSPEDVVAILKQCCMALNHEDENYIPAIKYAIRYIERGDQIELGMGKESL